MDVPIGIDLKFRISPRQLPEVDAQLNKRARFGRYALERVDRRRHVDSYFDRAGALRTQNAFLRVRDIDSNITITYRRQTVRSLPDAVVTELTNDALADLPEIFAAIIDMLRDSGVINVIDSPNVIRDGVVPSLTHMGLTELFRVATARSSWLVKDDERSIAKLVLDLSEYTTMSGARDRTHQLRIEPNQLTEPGVLRELRDVATNSLGLIADETAKRDHGWALYIGSERHDKIEVKVQLRRLTQYADLNSEFGRNRHFFPGYLLIGPGTTRELHDVYYDTDRLALAKRRSYLRVRTDNSQDVPVRDLTLRQMAVRGDMAHLHQTEHKVRLDQAGTSAAWNEIQRVLQSEGLMSGATNVGPTSLDDRLRRGGFSISLIADITRTAWIVEHAQSSEAETDSGQVVRSISCNDQAGPCQLPWPEPDRAGASAC